MRQAGLKPKSHSSGVYWTRATARTGRVKQSKPVISDTDESDNGPSKITIADIPPAIFGIVVLCYPIYLIIKYSIILVKKALASRG